jgi:hypothetical protein
LNAIKRLAGLLALSAIVYGGAVSPVAAESSLTRPEAPLGAGRIGNLDWAVSAYSQEGNRPLRAHDRQRPCIEARLEWSVGLHSNAGCYGPRYLTPTSEPMMIVVKELGKTAVGLAFAPAATDLTETFADGSQKTIHLRRLKQGPAQRMGRERFRFAAFAMEGEWCPKHLVSLNAAGQPLWEADEERCPNGNGTVEGIT